MYDQSEVIRLSNLVAQMEMRNRQTNQKVEIADEERARAATNLAELFSAKAEIASARSESQSLKI